MSRSKVTDEALLAAVPAAKDMFSLLKAVGVVPRGGNYETFRARLERLGALEERFRPRPRAVAVRVRRAALDSRSREELAALVAGSTGVASFLRALDLPTTSSTYRLARRLLEEHGFDTRHWVGQAHNRGKRLPRRVPLESVLVRGRFVHGSALGRRLVEERVVEDRCAGCGGTTWMGCAIPLELDHVSGDRTDNRLENLRLLCPNCHALTPTYRGRNIGRPSSAA